MKKLIATDLDGTLFHPHRFSRLLPKKNIKLIRDYIDAGGRVLLISSRGKETMEKVQTIIDRPLDYICYNGALTVKDGVELDDKYFKREVLVNLYDEIQKFEPPGLLLSSKEDGMLVLANRGNKFLRFIYKIYSWSMGARRESYKLSKESFEKAIKEGTVYKFIVFFGLSKNSQVKSKDFNKVIRDSFTDVESSWSHVFNEVTEKGCNKGLSLDKYVKSLGLKAEDVVCVGDSGNDIAMFKKYNENSFCMKHAHKTVRKYAKHTIKYYHHLRKYLMLDEMEKQK